ncbi:MAG: hypothetical protein V1656_00170 [Candidatus Jorgensenbacteria bacterium]
MKIQRVLFSLVLAAIGLALIYWSTGIVLDGIKVAKGDELPAPTSQEVRLPKNVEIYNAWSVTIPTQQAAVTVTTDIENLIRKSNQSGTPTLVVLSKEEITYLLSSGSILYLAKENIEPAPWETGLIKGNIKLTGTTLSITPEYSLLNAIFETLFGVMVLAVGMFLFGLPFYLLFRRDPNQEQKLTDTKPATVV